MSSSYEKVRGSKLNFKGGLGVDRNISKKTKKKKKKIHKDEPVDGDENVELVLEGGEGAAASKSTDATEIDTGSGHAPDGKKSKKYEELFPVETRRHGRFHRHPGFSCLLPSCLKRARLEKIRTARDECIQCLLTSL
ncbi:unnamed protein product [Calypogeia fissa]